MRVKLTYFELPESNVSEMDNNPFTVTYEGYEFPVELADFGLFANEKANCYLVYLEDVDNDFKEISTKFGEGTKIITIASDSKAIEHLISSFVDGKRKRNNTSFTHIWIGEEESLKDAIAHIKTMNENQFLT